MLCFVFCAVLSVFSSDNYNRKEKVLVICLAGCAVVSVFGLVENRQFFCCGGKVLLRPEKKVQVICLAGCSVVSVLGSGGK